MALSPRVWSLLSFVIQILTARAEEQVCTVPEPGGDRQLQHFFRHLILHEDYPRCGSVNFAQNRLVCEVWDASDQDAVRNACGADQQLANPFISCPDGSRNQTCVPIKAGRAYVCACHSLKQYTKCANSSEWDGEWRDIEGSQQGLYRQLCDRDTLSCPVTEYRFGVAHLVKYTQLPDSNISSSSVSGTTVHAPKRVRIDDYLDRPCCLTLAKDDPEKWVQFDLVQPYVALGALIRERCDYDVNVQRPTKLDIAYSPDATGWEFAASDVTPVYEATASLAHLSYTHWFQQPGVGRYWRVYVREWLRFPSLKADIIGYV